MVLFNNNSNRTFHAHYQFIQLLYIVAANISNYVVAFGNARSVQTFPKLSSAVAYRNHPHYSGPLPPSVHGTTTCTNTITNRREQPYHHSDRRYPHHATTATFTKSLQTTTNLRASSSPSSPSSNIDFQSDVSLYGRGERHLSAVLNEHDVVVYQTGSWEVDGATVGDDPDAPPIMKYCKVDTLQIVWTHNCEHGVIRGISVEIGGGGTIGSGSANQEEGSDSSCRDVSCCTTPDDDLEFVEFGPEQLVARLPVEWLDEGCERGYLAVPLPDEVA